MLESKPKLIDLNRLLQEIVDDFQQIHAETHTLNLRSWLDNSTLIRLDKKLMRQIVTNLLSNAIKYSPLGGTVVIRLGKRKDNAVIEVLDNGPGIALEDREKIFDPFYRSKTAVVSGTKGTGLGLAIVRDYVEMHRGSVSAIAAVGARFRVVLPKQNAQNLQIA